MSVPPGLFAPFTLDGVTLRNRIAISPMCQYSAEDGVVGDWHLVNLGARAVGGAGLVIAEATAVSPEGRITPGCAGLWTNAQGAAWARIAAFVKSQGAVPGIQIGHAGRKAAANRPWEGDDHFAPDDPRAWEPVAPSAVAFGGNLPRVPRAMDANEIARVQADFVAAARRALDAGFEWLELHAAHGYLLQSFLSPVANRRTDGYGGNLAGRGRMLRETFAAVRAVWPQRYPLAIRLGVSDFTEKGVTLDEAIALLTTLRADGLSLVDVSISLNSPDVSGVPWEPGFMLPYAGRIREETGLPTAASWMLDDPVIADKGIRHGRIDLAMIARPSLVNPHWPYQAAERLGQAPWQVLPPQYGAWLKRRTITERAQS